ncbi:MAG: MGMT family protein [Lentisphaerota bacterium]
MNSSPDISVLGIQSAWGLIEVTAKDGLIASCSLPLLKAEPSKPFVWSGLKIKASNRWDEAVLKKAAAFIKSVLSGKAAPSPSFQWPESSPFTSRVWKALLLIEPGATITYSALAKKIGRPGGARAVGRACGANPLPLFIPCHRVLPCDGSLGGFSCGLPWKRHLLEMERILPAL